MTHSAYAAMRASGRKPMEEQLRRDALEYHRLPTFGEISVTPTKSLVNQRDLALAYSPGVAYACLAIKDDPSRDRKLRAKKPANGGPPSQVSTKGGIARLGGGAERHQTACLPASRLEPVSE